MNRATWLPEAELIDMVRVIADTELGGYRAEELDEIRYRAVFTDAADGLRVVFEVGYGSYHIQLDVLAGEAVTVMNMVVSAGRY